MSSIPSEFSPMGTTMKNAFAKIIDFSGDTTVSYDMRGSSGVNEYGETTTFYSSTTITAYVRPLGDKEVDFIEPGFLRQHYAKLYMTHDDITPATLDRFTWSSITFEVRSAIPVKWDDSIIRWELLGRRVGL